MMKGPENVSDEEWLKELKLFCLERGGSGNLINVYKYPNGGYKENGGSHFSVASSTKTRGSRHKLDHACSI